MLRKETTTYGACIKHQNYLIISRTICDERRAVRLVNFINSKERNCTKNIHFISRQSSAKIFKNVKASNINFGNSKNIRRRKSFKPNVFKIFSLGVPQLQDNVGRNNLIKGDSVQQFANICRRPFFHSNLKIDQYSRLTHIHTDIALGKISI